MFKDSKANKIFMIAVLAILFILIIGNKSTKNQKITYNNIEISNSIIIESLSDINIWVDDSLPSPIIVYSTKGNGELEVNSNNGDTTVKEKLKKRFFLSIDFEDDSSSISLYLPSSKINDIEIYDTVGDINTYNKIQANNINLKSISGDINILDIDATNIVLETVSGDITTGAIDNLDSLNFKTISGDISTEAMNTKTASVNSISGDIQILKTYVYEDFELLSTSGDIEVVIANSKNFNIKTTTGTIEINDKEIEGNSYSEGAGNNSFKTISGDIEVNY